MFRIEKRLVQEASPAEIPLIPIHQAVVAAVAAPLPELNAALPPELPRETKQAVDNLLQQAQLRAEAQLKAAKQEAEALLGQTERQIAAMLAEAEQQAQKICAEAEQQGLESGRAAGLQLYQQQNQEAALQLQRLISEMSGAREAFFDSFETDTVDLALAIAEKIVNMAIHRDDQAFLAIIKYALKHMRREGRISVRVSEEQYNAFFKAESATFVLGDESVTATIVNDPLLKDGDLVLESDGETVNAGLSSQLKYIRLAFGQPQGEEG